MTDEQKLMLGFVVILILGVAIFLGTYFGGSFGKYKFIKEYKLKESKPLARELLDAETDEEIVKVCKNFEPYRKKMEDDGIDSKKYFTMSGNKTGIKIVSDYYETDVTKLFSKCISANSNNTSNTSNTTSNTSETSNVSNASANVVLSIEAVTFMNELANIDTNVSVSNLFFTRYDTDLDGFVSRDELTSANVSANVITDLMFYDVDADDKISTSEFTYQPSETE